MTDFSFDIRYGDCFRYLSGVPERSVDALISDPPYGTTNLSWDQAVDWDRFWKEVVRICKPLAVVALFSAQPFTTDLINSNRGSFRYELIWEKSRGTGFLNANRRPLTNHENILVFSRRFLGSTYHPQKVPGKPYTTKHGATRGGHWGEVKDCTTVNQGDRHPKSVLHLGSHNNGGEHPTQKPLELMQWLVRSYSNPGDVVLDPFMGSGSTGVAAMLDDRRFIGFERERDYFYTAQRRIDQAWAA